MGLRGDLTRWTLKTFNGDDYEDMVEDEKQVLGVRTFALEQLRKLKVEWRNESHWRERKRLRRRDVLDSTAAVTGSEEETLRSNPVVQITPENHAKWLALTPPLPWTY